MDTRLSVLPASAQSGIMAQQADSFRLPKRRLIPYILSAFVLGVMLAAALRGVGSVWVWSWVPLVVGWFLFEQVPHRLYPWLISLLMLCAFGYGLGEGRSAIETGLADRLQSPMTIDADVRVMGISDGVNEHWRQVVRCLDPRCRSGELPEDWLIYDKPYFGHRRSDTLPVTAMRPGEIWHVALQLRPPHGIASPAAFDTEEWLLTSHIGATGTVKSALRVDADSHGLRLPLDLMDRYRLSLRERIAGLDTPAYAVLLSLVTGDRALVDPAVQALYQQAGISHLLAISGPHVVLAAFMFAWLVQRVLNLRPRRYLLVPRPYLLLPLMMVMVVVYACLAGWGVPTLRTVLMFGLSSGLALVERRWPTSQILLMALAITLWWDPLSIYQSGLWLSFVATAILLSLVRHTEESPYLWQRYWLLLKHTVQLQLAMFILLIPVTLYFFHRIPLMSVVVNLVAIPVIGGVVVPLALIALAISWVWSGMADALWIFAAGWLEQLHAWMQWLPLPAWTATLSGVSACGLVLALVILRAPKGSVPRWLVLPCLMPLVVPIGAASLGVEQHFGAAHDAPLRVQVLDVGQGLAVIIQTSHHTLLYDAGPKRADAFDGMGERVVLPALATSHITHLDKLIISHASFEHDGGFDAVRAQIPIDEIVSSKRIWDVPTSFCAAGESWQWDGVDFAFLAPWYDDTWANLWDEKDHSCVLRISTRSASGQPVSMLLMGDAGEATEARLVQSGVLTSNVLLVGDHGSDRASNPLFLQAVKPQIAMISTSYLNRKYPSAQVVDQLKAAGSRIYTTADHGSLTIDLGGRKPIEVAAYRDQYEWLKPAQVP